MIQVRVICLSAYGSGGYDCRKVKLLTWETSEMDVKRCSRKGVSSYHVPCVDYTKYDLMNVR